MTLSPYNFDDLLVLYRTSVATHSDNAGTLQDAGPATPRIAFDNTGAVQRGLLIEPKSQNLIPNPRAIGGAAGSPGTNATGWTSPGSVLSLTQTLGYGTENGRDYVELTLTGTASGGGPLFFYFAGISDCAVGITHPYTLTAGLKLQAGSTANVTFELQQQEYQSGGVLNGNTITSAIVPTSTYQAFTLTHAGLAGSTATIRPSLRMGFTTSGAVNFTLRIYTPRLERGYISTSTMRPLVGSSGISTRQADDVRMRDAAFAACFTSPAAFGFVVDAMVMNSAPADVDQGILRIDDGTEANKIVLTNPAGTSDVHFKATAASVSLFDLPLGSFTPSSPFRVAVNCQASHWRGSINAGLPATSSSPSMPSGLIEALIGRASLIAGDPYDDSASMLNGFLRSIMLAPAALSLDQVVGASNLNNSIHFLLTAGGAPAY